MDIRGSADQIPTDFGQWKIAGREWTASCAAGWRKALTSQERFNLLDLSEAQFVPMFEWVAAIALMERLLASPHVSGIGIDLLGKSPHPLLSWDEYFEWRRQSGTGRKPPRYVHSDRVYRIAGFLESLGTLQVLNRDRRAGRASYVGLEQAQAQLKSYHTSDSGHTVVQPLTRIESRDDCLQFLDEERIRSWREAMTIDDRFRMSPLFRFDELWRIFCHELAANIWEHSNSVGFLAGHVVSYMEGGKVRPWCRATYPKIIQDLFPHFGGHFLELCISDAGEGFVDTLGKAYRREFASKDSELISAPDILQFAFDELGTCKNPDESWATSRHALGRLLQMVAKYGGALTLRSSGAEVVYATKGGKFVRIPGHRGYRAQSNGVFAPEMPGSHLQLILPLNPVLPFDSQRSVLMSSLPEGFYTDAKHVRGHLVPLLEALGSIEPRQGASEVRDFRRRCERLATVLLKERPAEEPLVIDFHSVQWSAAQFETLLHLLQNVLQQRPVLLVEINTKLAREVVSKDWPTAPTTLDASTKDGGAGAAGRRLDNLSEKTYLETFRAVHATILGLDADARPYIFGLPDRDTYETPLLSLIKRPASLKDLAQSPKVEEIVLRAIFNNINPLFEVKAGLWTTVWNSDAIEIEAARVMSRHFDAVADRCKAWRGRGEEVGRYFNLPWQEEWVTTFFECARILSRERHADEAGQRLVYRLQEGLRIAGRDIEEVEMLACVTAPAILLASAMHRFWPCEKRPAIADLGPYILLHPEGKLPFLAVSGSIVVVQDVLDKGQVSGRLIRLLRQQGKSVLAKIALVRLIRQNPALEFGLYSKAAHVMSIGDGWKTNNGEVAAHAMIELFRDEPCPEPADSIDDRKLFWVEPRTLRPFRYSVLRGAHRSGLTQPKRRPWLKPFFDPDGPSLLSAGHYIFGEKHYTIAIDIRRAFDGAIGDQIANGIADICEAQSSRQPADWETERGGKLGGAVTAVLMPLHSRIHYLWPKVEILLAQRGRRQPMWLLDATLFLGGGPNYRLPLQFHQQLKDCVKASLNKDATDFRAMRILIVDDAIHSARTADTILHTLLWSLGKAYEEADPNNPTPAASQAVEWIRYFAVFNQMTGTQRQHWRNLSIVGENPSVNFVFEDFGHVPGAPIYRETECPVCADTVRYQHLMTAAERHSAPAASEWARKRLDEIRPVAVDSPGFHQTIEARLPRILHLLVGGVTDPADELLSRYRVSNVDVAIWRFHELMYYSRPPSDVLKALNPSNAWAAQPSEAEYAASYARFRWAVLEWCIRNWARVIADGAQIRFANCVWREIRRDTSLVEPLLDAVGTQANDFTVRRLVVKALLLLARFEQRRDTDAFTLHLDDQCSRLANALALYFLNIPRATLNSLEMPHHEGRASKFPTLLAFLENLSTEARPLTFVRNLHRSLMSRNRHAEVSLALRTVAEAISRGRNEVEPAGGTHWLLPQLLKEVSDHPEYSGRRSLLLGSLGLFLSALEALESVAPTTYYARNAIEDGASSTQEVIELAQSVFEWLKEDPESIEGKTLPGELAPLRDRLLPGSSFCKEFQTVFHQSVVEIREHLNDHCGNIADGTERLTFQVLCPPEVESIRILTHVHRLWNFLANWAINPASETTTDHSSRIDVMLHPQKTGYLLVRVLTNYADLMQTNRRTLKGPNYATEKSIMETFGVVLAEEWIAPIGAEATTFTAVFHLAVPIGFNPKQQ